MVEAIRNYLLNCPVLKVFSMLGVDYLEADAENYSIETLPSDYVHRKYVDGGSLKRYDFAICSRSFYGPDHAVNIENLDFFERLRNWFSEQELLKNLPDLPDGRSPVRFEVLSQGYLLDANEETAKYQIQCRLIYY